MYISVYPNGRKRIRDPNLRIRDPNLGIGDPNLGIRDPNLGIRDPNLGIPDPSNSMYQCMHYFDSLMDWLSCRPISF